MVNVEPELFEAEVETRAQDMVIDLERIEEEVTELPEDLMTLAVEEGWNLSETQAICVRTECWAYLTPAPRVPSNEWPFRTTFLLSDGTWRRNMCMVCARACTQCNVEPLT